MQAEKADSALLPGLHTLLVLVHHQAAQGMPGAEERLLDIPELPVPLPHGELPRLLLTMQMPLPPTARGELLRLHLQAEEQLAMPLRVLER